MSQVVLMRPIQSTASEYQVRMRPTGGTWHTWSSTAGVYSNIMQLIDDCEKDIDANIGGGVSTTFQVTQGDNLQGNNDVLIKVSANPAVDIEFLNSDTQRLFGATSSTYNNFTSNTFESRPRFTWVSTYTVGNQDRFHLMHKETYSGQQTKTGHVHGTVTGPRIYYRMFDFFNETAHNLFAEAMPDNTNTEDWSQLNLEYFVEQARSVVPDAEDYESPKGFWFWPSISSMATNYLLIPGGAAGSSTSRVGIKFDLTTTPDLFCRCQFEPFGMDIPKSVDSPTGRTYYNASFQIHTIEDTFAYKDIS